MKWKFWQKEERGIEQTTAAQPAQWLIDMFGSELASGVVVNDTTAMQLAAVFACVKVLAESVACLPLALYQATERGREKAINHPLYWIVHSRPNPEMTAAELIECLQGHLTLRGNGFAEIVRDGSGAPRELWPLRADKMQVKRSGGQLVYVYTLPDNRTVIVPAYNVLHLRGLSSDGIAGMSPITQAREAVGLALAAEKFGGKLFAQGARPSGVLSTDTVLSEEAYQRLKKEFNSQYTGIDAASRLMILEQGLSFSAVSVTPEDAQFLETRKYQRSEIAALFRVPPHMIGDLEKATFSNIEQQSLDFVQYTLLPWLTKWEQRLNVSLLTPKEIQAGYFFKFNVAGYLRGDFSSRMAGYAVGRQNGWLSANDIRQLEDMNTIENGDVYLVPLNMTPADQVGKATETKQSNKPPPGPGDTARSLCSCGREHAEHYHPGDEIRARVKTTESFEDLFKDAAGRVIHREAEQVRKAARKHLATRDNTSFEAWLEQFYGEEFPEFVIRKFMPVLQSMAPIVFNQAMAEVNTEGQQDDSLPRNIEKYAAVMAQQHAGKSQSSLKTAVRDNPEDPLGAVDGQVSEWESERADKIAKSEVVRYANYIAKIAFLAAGIAYLRWDARGGSCEICQALDGVIVGIRETFAAAGMNVGGMTVKANVHYPPLHSGCKCAIRAERK